MWESFDGYLALLNEWQGRLPKHVYDFAGDIERHNLTSPRSLHDAWVESITVSEHRNDERPFDARLQIQLVLLGPMHDRKFSLVYTGVARFELGGVSNQHNVNDTFHGDLLKHRVILDADGIENPSRFSGSVPKLSLIHI